MDGLDHIGLAFGELLATFTGDEFTELIGSFLEYREYLLAACTARVASSLFDRWNSPSTVSVSAGSSDSNVSPEDASTHSPLI